MQEGRLYDLAVEAEHTRKVIESPAEFREIISEIILGQTLFALWDSGFYEFVRARERFTFEEAAESLRFEPLVFHTLLEYLVGRGHLTRAGATFTCTEKGIRTTNAFARGLLHVYLGGYGAILNNLGPLLRKELSIHDPALDRSGAQVARGTELVMCSVVVPAVLATLRERGIRRVLDVGCGTGGFLIGALRSGELASGVGLDHNPAAVSGARESAAAAGVADRMTIIEAELGPRLALPPDEVEGIEAITAMFILHEFGRDGRQAIGAVVRELAAHFRDRLLVMLEVIPGDPDEMGRTPPADFNLLNYAFIHPLSRQGSPRPPEDWKAIFLAAGCKSLELKRINDEVGMYLVRL
jgi:SAM-dependent methyltransferase